MAATNRKSNKSSSTLTEQSKKSPEKHGKIKPKRKHVSRNSSRPMLVVSSVSLLVIAFAANHFLNLTRFLPNELRFLGFFSSKKPFQFKSRPIPEFDIARGIDRRSNLSLEEFIELYDAKWPVLITDAMDNWPAMKKWNKRFFMQNYADKVVSFKGVMGTLDQRQGLAAPLGVFLQHVHEASQTSWTYAEDEVFLVRNPKLKDDIKTPIYLKEDFFSLLPEPVRPWNAMLLWGTKYSRSTLHIDPYNWTGTNAVIKGKKLWKMYPPGQDHLLYVPSGRKSGFPLDCPKYQSSVDAFDYKGKKYPMFERAKAIEFEQLPGEMLIIPTGWFHQAYNAEETLAISSQIMNSQNHEQVLAEIIKGKNINEEDITNEFESFKPKDKVAHLVALFPRRIVEHGKNVNKDVMEQLDRVKVKS